VEAEEENGENEPAVLVNVASFHSEQAFRGFLRNLRWRRWWCSSGAFRTAFTNIYLNYDWDFTGYQ